MAPKYANFILSYHRGVVVLRHALYNLPPIDLGWENPVLNNGSSPDSEEYSEIESLFKLADRVKYVKHAETWSFNGNVFTCIKFARTTCMQIKYDDSYANPRLVRDTLSMFSEFPYVGLIRRSIGAMRAFSQAIAKTTRAVPICGNP